MCAKKTCTLQIGHPIIQVTKPPARDKDTWVETTGCVDSDRFEGKASGTAAKADSRVVGTSVRNSDAVTFGKVEDALPCDPYMKIL
jgi:hypothetical protein